MEKHIVMDDEKMTSAYAGDDRTKLEPASKSSRSDPLHP